jgi:hypothetical protein
VAEPFTALVLNMFIFKDSKGAPMRSRTTANQAAQSMRPPRLFVAIAGALLCFGVTACGNTDDASTMTAGAAGSAPAADVSSTSSSSSSSSTSPPASTTSTIANPDGSPQERTSTADDWSTYRAGLQGQVEMESETVDAEDGAYRVVARTSGTERIVDVARFDGETWRTVSTVTLPAPDYTFGTQRAIQSADVTGDRRPDFLVPLEAAQRIGVVISDTSGKWTAVPVQGADGSAVEPYLGVNPRVEAATLVSDERVCDPNCAEGRTRIVEWRYHNGMLVRSDR